MPKKQPKEYRYYYVLGRLIPLGQTITIYIRDTIYLSDPYTLQVTFDGKRLEGEGAARGITQAKRQK